MIFSFANRHTLKTRILFGWFFGTSLFSNHMDRVQLDRENLVTQAGSGNSISVTALPLSPIPEINTKKIRDSVSEVDRLHI
jgi:hypothetical protein